MHVAYSRLSCNSESTQKNKKNISLILGHCELACELKFFCTHTHTHTHTGSPRRAHNCSAFTRPEGRQGHSKMPAPEPTDFNPFLRPLGTMMLLLGVHRTNPKPYRLVTALRVVLYGFCKNLERSRVTWEQLYHG